MLNFKFKLAFFTTSSKSSSKLLIKVLCNVIFFTLKLFILPSLVNYSSCFMDVIYFHFSENQLVLLWYGHLMQRTDSLEKTLILGKIEGRRRRGDRRWDGWIASPTQWTWVWVSSGSWWWAEKPGVLQSMGLQSQTCLNSTEGVQHVDLIHFYVAIWLPQ